MPARTLEEVPLLHYRNEALRCLKRQLSDVVDRCMVADALARTAVAA